MTPTDAADTISLKDLAAILARRKWLILVTFFLVVGGVAAGTLLMPKQYETRMKVLVKNERENGGEVFQGNSIGCVSRGHRGSLLATGCIWMRKRGDHSNPINSSRLRLRDR